MKSIDIYYQGEGIREIEHIEIPPEETFGGLKLLISKKHELQGELVVFIEDHDSPMDDATSVKEHVHKHGVKVHVHRCRHVEVKVAFNGETVADRFAPGATVARVKHWAAVKKFGMTEEEAGEHVLQISGTQERPKPGTHLGTLASCPHCNVAFDLVPDQRVNGAFEVAK